MTIAAVEHPALPPLAWLCAVPAAAGGAVRLHRGRSVVVRDDAFFEGAWSGPFDALAFATCAAVFGSGAARRGTEWVFVPPSHTLEALYLWSHEATTVVSNSLAFLLACTGTRLDPFDWACGARFAAIVQGLDATPIAVPVDRGILQIVHHHNVVVAPGEASRLEPKPLPPRFADFAAYVGYVESTLREIADNADAPGRPRRYRLLTSISGGYDSPACAVLGRAAGCMEAVTLVGGDGGGDDSGSEIGRRLGLAVHEVREVPPDSDAISEAEFLATGMQGEDVVYRAFEAHLGGRILLTGFHGDKVWEKTIPPSADIKRGDISGSSLGEFRLARDFVHVPVPFIGCRRHEDIWRISNASDMSAYSIGGHYDRPIARRLVESASVPRAAFARDKLAASRHVFLDPSLLSTSTRREITAYWHAGHGPLRPRLRYWAAAARWELGLLAVRLGRAMRGRRAPRPHSGATSFPDRRNAAFRRVFGMDFAVFEHSHPRASIWLRWAVDQMRERYRSAGTLPAAATVDSGPASSASVRTNDRALDSRRCVCVPDQPPTRRSPGY